MVLTQGEKMVWAVAWFSVVTDPVRRPRRLDPEERAKAILEMRREAMNEAAEFVRDLRDTAKENAGLVASMSPDEEEAFQMLRAMLGDEG